MRRENRNESKKENDEETIKWGKLLSFIVAIILLAIAIAFSMTQEKELEQARYNYINNTNTEEASFELSKNVNQIIEENNIIGGDNEEETEDNLNEIINTLETNSNIVEENIVNNIQVSENVIKENENNIEEKKEETNEKTNQFIFPVEGDVIKEFAKDSLIYSETLEEWITHLGIDIKAERTSIVKSVADGKVTAIKNDPRYGLTVIIEHNDGYVSSYSSLLTAEFVKEGEEVKQGQTIGTVGNSAVFEVAEDNHLHFELLKDGSNINPEMYLK